MSIVALTGYVVKKRWQMPPLTFGRDDFHSSPYKGLKLNELMVTFWVFRVRGPQSRFDFTFWFLNRRLRIQRRGNWYRAFTNPFASSSINFGFALKLFRIKDQWYTVLVKCQFVCNWDVSVLPSMPFDGTSSGGKCYGAGRRRLSPGSFQKGLENREGTEK